MVLIVSGVLVGFTQEVVRADEGVGLVHACVEVCEGILKRNVTILVDYQNGTALCKLRESLALQTNCALLFFQFHRTMMTMRGGCLLSVQTTIDIALVYLS